MHRAHAPAARPALLGTTDGGGNRMLLGSSISYLPLQVGRDVSDLDLPAPAKRKPWVRGMWSAGMQQQEGKGFLEIRQQLGRTHQSIRLPHTELEQLVPGESHFSQPWPGHHPLGLKLSRECSLLMLAVRFPRKPPEMSLCRATAAQARLGCVHTLTTLHWVCWLGGDRTRGPPWPARLSLEGGPLQCILLMFTASQQRGPALYGET